MIANTETKVSYKGDGQTTSFPYTFVLNDASEIRITIYDNESRTSRTLDKDFYVDTSVKVVRYPGYTPGQEPAESERPAVLTEKESITIYRETKLTQDVDLGTKYPLYTIERMVDKVTMILQEMSEHLGRTITVDIGGDIKPSDYLATLKEYVSITQEYMEKVIACGVMVTEKTDQAARSEEVATDSAKSAQENAEKIAEVVGKETEEITKKVINNVGDMVKEKVDAELTPAIQDITETVTEKLETQYKQVTKLNTSMLKGVYIPVKTTNDFCRAPLEVLKLRDDGISSTITHCDFTDGDAADFISNENVAFNKGSASLKLKHHIKMSDPVAFADGTLSVTDEIDLSSYQEVIEVKIS